MSKDGVDIGIKLPPGCVTAVLYLPTIAFAWYLIEKFPGKEWIGISVFVAGLIIVNKISGVETINIMRVLAQLWPQITGTRDRQLPYNENEDDKK